MPKKSTVKSKAQREALKDRTNIRDASDTEEIEDFGDETEQSANGGSAGAKQMTKKSRAGKETEDVEGPVKKKARTQKSKTTNGDAEEARAAPKTAASGARKTAATKRAPSAEPERVIPETQPIQEDITESVEADAEGMEVDNPPAPQRAQRDARHEIQRARSTSVQRQLQSHGIQPRARSVSQQPRHFSRDRSPSDAGRRVADADGKRKLADMTSKYEDMRLKYESLQELGRNGAESNFDKLKRATDQRAKGE